MDGKRRSHGRGAGIAGSGTGIEWAAVHEKLARQNATLDEIFAGRGPWADALLNRRAELLAERSEMPDLDRPALPLLLARGAETLYGLELRYVAHIVPLPRLARIPGAIPALLGVIAVGGRVMRLFDLDRLCGGVALAMAPGDRGLAGYAVILRAGSGRPVALRLAAVEEVTAIEAPRCAAPLEAGGFIKTITTDRIAILDMPAIFDFVKT